MHLNFSEEDLKILKRMKRDDANWQSQRVWLLFAAAIFLAAGIWFIWQTLTNSIHRGVVDPVEAVLIVPMSWVLFLFGAVIFSYTITRWKFRRSDKILLKISQLLSGLEQP